MERRQGTEENHDQMRNQKKKTHKGGFWFNDELAGILEMIVVKEQKETKVSSVELIDWEKVTKMFMAAVQDHPFNPIYINKYKLKRRYLNYFLDVNNSALSNEEFEYLLDQIPKHKVNNKIQWKAIAKLQLLRDNGRTPNTLKNKYYSYIKAKEKEGDIII